MDKEAVFKNTILRGVVGSTSLGTAIPGTDDRDEMGVCVEPIDHVAGLEHFEHYIQRDQPEGVRSQPGDLDLTIYSLRKFCRLVAQGNPSVLILLWLPEYVVMTDIGRRLLEIRKAFFSAESGKRFLGYLLSQRAALVGDRSPKVQRPELVERFGYDTKFAMHALRLGYQGIHMLTEEQIVLPIPEDERHFLMEVRQGMVTKDAVVDQIDVRAARLRELVDQTVMIVDRVRINNFLVTAHRDVWESGTVR